MKKGKMSMLMLISSSFLMMTACSSGNKSSISEQEQTKASATPAEPVSLTMGRFTGGKVKADFDKYDKPFLEKKFPNIKVEFTNDESLEKNIAAGDVPDILAAGYNQIQNAIRMDYPIDMTPLIKKQNLDLSKYNPMALDSLKQNSNAGQLNALPYKINTFALFYNKSIFDKFGVAYPKDDMTWEEATEVAKRVTRTDGKTSYSGLQYSANIAVFSEGVALNLVDPKTDKVLFNNASALKVLKTLKNIYSIPGNEWQGKILDRFVAGETAMIPWWAQDTLTQIEEGNKNLDWDMVTYPHFTGMNGIIEPTTGTYMISKQSKHQEEALQVISYLTTSPEVQTTYASAGNIPVIDLPNIKDIYGTNFDIIKGKNVAGMLKGKFLGSHNPSFYDTIAQNAYNKYTQQYLTGKLTDPNTALQKAEDEATKNIAADKGK